MCTSTGKLRQTGVSLIEVIIFIVIVSVGVVGLISVMDSTLKFSADPMLRKQAIAIAESLLEEIELQPFTFCDPDDPNNLNDPPPASGAGCSGGANGANDQGAMQGGRLVGPQAGEARGSATAPFDNVADYARFSMTGIRSIDDGSVTIAGLEKYKADVEVAPAGGDFSLPAGAVLKIGVTVTTPNNDTVTLTGYRFRYAPNATP